MDLKQELRTIKKDITEQWNRSVDDGYLQSFMEFSAKYCLAYHHENKREDVIKKFEAKKVRK